MNNSRDPQNAYLKNLKSRIDRKFVEGVNFVDIRLPSFNNRKILNFIKLLNLNSYQFSCCLQSVVYRAIGVKTKIFMITTSDIFFIQKISLQPKN